MHNITIYFVGGTSVRLEECDDNFTSKINAWLTDDSLKVFKVDIPTYNRTKLIRKDLVLFIDID